MRNFEVAKKKAFTLSEILIVLAIIGFVASVILGVIRLNTNRQFVAGSSLFSNDIAVSLAAMNVEVPLTSFKEDKAGFIQKFSQYFDILFKTSNPEVVFDLDKMKDEARNKLELEEYDVYFVTKNGVSVGLSYVDSGIVLPKFVPDVSTMVPGDKGFETLNNALSYVKIVYDLNGPKGPNVLGRDIGFIDYDGYSTDPNRVMIPPVKPGGPVTNPIITLNKLCPNGQTYPETCAEEKMTWMPGDDNCGTCVKPSCPISECPDGQKPMDSDSPDCYCKSDSCKPKFCPKGQKFDLEKCTCTVESTPKECDPKTQCCKTCDEGYELVNPGSPDCYCRKEECSIPACPSGQIMKNVVNNYPSCSRDCVCPSGSKEKCKETGGTFNEDTCKCECPTSDKCGYKVYVNKTNSKKEQYCEAQCKVTLNDKNTYFKVTTGTNYDHCFKCNSTSKNNMVSVKEVIPNKPKTGNQCRCDISCKNPAGSSKAGSSKSGSSNGWACESTRERNKKLGLGRIYFTGTAPINSAEACTWHCDLQKDTPDGVDCSGKTFTCTRNEETCDCEIKVECDKPDKHPANSHYKLNPKTCKYNCVYEKKDPRKGDYWKWTGDDKERTFDEINDNINKKKYYCDWKCDTKELHAAYNSKSDRNNWKELTDYPHCELSYTCKLNRPICEKAAEECIQPLQESTFSSCTQAKRGYYAFYEGHIYTPYKKRCQLYKPGFNDGHDWHTSYYCDGSGGHISATYKGNYVNCDTKGTQTIKGEFDEAKCRCIFTITDKSGTHHPNNNTYVFRYEGWSYKKNSSGEYKKDDWHTYKCKYELHKTSDFKVKKGSFKAINPSSKVKETYTCDWLNKNGKLKIKSSSGSGSSGSGSSSYTYKIEEKCTALSDPILFVMNDENPTSIAGKFSTNKDDALSLNGAGNVLAESGETHTQTMANDTNSYIYWMPNSVNQGNYLYLIKDKTLSTKSPISYIDAPTGITSWNDIQALMFTDLGEYSNGLNELAEYATEQMYNGNNITFVDKTSKNWDKLKLALIQNNGGNATISAKSLDDYKITEISIVNYRPTDISRDDSAGAIGALIGCYRKGTGDPETELPSDGYARTVVNINGKNQTQYCKVRKDDAGNDVFENCEFETSTGKELGGNIKAKYSYDYNKGECSRTSGLGNSSRKFTPYYYDGKNFYEEKAFTLVDVLFKSPDDIDANDEIDKKNEKVNYSDTEELQDTNEED